MFAVIQTGGKQYRVAEGQLIRVEQLSVPPGQEVEIRDVLLVHAGEGDIRVGSPTVADAVVHARVDDEGLARKVIVFKKKRRKQYKRFKGHRQPFTALRIEKISV